MIFALLSLSINSNPVKFWRGADLFYLCILCSYVLDRMRKSEIQRRVEAVLETDWKKEAEAVLERRESGEEEGPVCSPLVFVSVYLDIDATMF